jgi:predicted TIM-barrel fold metal-dependent hydrolase
MSTLAQPETVAEEPRLALIDCDVHPNLPNGISDLMPYLTASWQQRLGVLQDKEWAKDLPSSQFSLPHNVLYQNTAGAMRRDTTEGGMPGGDPKFVAGHLLDACGIDRAILLGGSILGLGALPDPDAAAVLARAHNDWLTDFWLEQDYRYRGSIVVAPQDPAQAVEEIARVGDRAQMVQVLLPMTNILMGERHYYPIYAAAAERGLPIAVHLNTVDGIFPKGPPMAGGVPTYYVEWHTGLTQVFQASFISLLCHGVFERFPGLRVVFAETGFAWALDVLWRLDRNWKSLRDEIPWVRRLPSEYAFDHVRFTTQPFVETKREYIEFVCEALHAERTLLFSSDYPHWDFDDPKRALRLLPDAIRQNVFADSAIELYGERLTA